MVVATVSEYMLTRNRKEDEKDEETGMPELEGEGEEDEVEALPSTGNPKIEEIP